MEGGNGDQALNGQEERVREREREHYAFSTSQLCTQTQFVCWFFWGGKWADGDYWCVDVNE